MITFQEYCEIYREKQSQYITSEFDRLKEAKKLHQKFRNISPLQESVRAYKNAMEKIGFHPLTSAELDARHEQLCVMFSMVEKGEYGDEKVMRALYKMYINSCY